MKKLYLLMFLLVQSVQAGLPPTTSQVSGDPSDITTFKYRFPNFTGTHTGTIISLGINSIAGGGTGQSTQTNAFDALSPTTTKGDLIAHNGSDNVRVAVGVNNQVLLADSAQAAGVKWGNLVGTTYGAYITNNGSACAISRQTPGAWVSSVAINGSARCDLTLTGFANAPICTATAMDAGSAIVTKFPAATTTTSAAVTTFLSSTATGQAANFYIQCVD